MPENNNNTQTQEFEQLTDLIHQAGNTARQRKRQAMQQHFDKLKAIAKTAAKNNAALVNDK
jgi:hypothetical protein